MEKPPSSLSRFTGAADHLPPNASVLDAHRIIERGWPLVALGDRPGLERLLARHADDLRGEKDLRVIHTSGILTRLGGTVAFPVESDQDAQRTADILMTFDGKLIDVEVTAAEKKPKGLEPRVTRSWAMGGRRTYLSKVSRPRSSAAPARVAA